MRRKAEARLALQTSVKLNTASRASLWELFLFSFFFAIDAENSCFTQSSGKAEIQKKVSLSGSCWIRLALSGRVIPFQSGCRDELHLRKPQRGQFIAQAAASVDINHTSAVSVTYDCRFFHCIVTVDQGSVAGVRAFPVLVFLAADDFSVYGEVEGILTVQAFFVGGVHDDELIVFVAGTQWFEEAPGLSPKIRRIAHDLVEGSIQLFIALHRFAAEKIFQLIVVIAWYTNSLPLRYNVHNESKYAGRIRPALDQVASECKSSARWTLDVDSPAIFRNPVSEHGKQGYEFEITAVYIADNVPGPTFAIKAMWCHRILFRHRRYKALLTAGVLSLLA
jgi:hypothetical protein